MTMIRKLALVAAIASTTGMSGCGGSSSSSNSAATSATITGTAIAPAGTVAQMEPQSIMEIALSFVISPVAAEITGLEPIKGADVELIRVDDEGNQVGDVLATTSTSITGDYTLTLPQGVNLAGNLIVRITGTNNQQLRAQVVEQSVDISPVSEFVLRKFIETGADLDELVVADVVKLNGRVEDFDLTAGLDLDAMFTKLEDEVGAFVENEVVVASAGAAPATSVAGTYVNTAYAFALHDSDGEGYGTFAQDLWIEDFTFAAGSSGTVNVTFRGGDSAYTNFSGTALENANPYYVTNTDDEEETFEASFTTAGVLSIEGEFEEDIDPEGENGWRYPGITYIFQEVSGQGVFAGLTHEASVRYALIDTDNDGDLDALDPESRAGDEVFRTLEFFIKKPENLTSASVQGDYGRVYFSSYIQNGFIELQTENNIVAFSGEYVVTEQGAVAHTLFVNGNGDASYEFEEVPASEAETIPVSADGGISGDEGLIGQVSSTGGFIDFTETDGCNGENAACQQGDFAEFEKTLLVKLPTEQLDVSGKTYRLMMMAVHLEGGGTNAINLAASQFNTVLDMTSNTAGTLSGIFSDVEMPMGLGSDVAASADQISEEAFTMTLAANGATSIAIGDSASDHTVLEGYFNEDGSLGVFTTGYVEANEDRDELGIAILIDITE